MAVPLGSGRARSEGQAIGPPALRSRSIADDGTILAIRGTSEIVRLTQSGEIIDSFFPSENRGSLYDLEVTADGEHVAWASITLCNRPDGTPDSCRNTHITYRRRPQPRLPGRGGADQCPDLRPRPDDRRHRGPVHPAAQIAATVLAENPGTTRALLARGDAFADAITGGAYAARAGVPILLTPSTFLATQTADFLQANPSVTEVVVLGGEAAVAEVVAQSLAVDTVGRVAGAERTATSAAIATELGQAEGLAGGGVVVVNVRADQGRQTALAAAVVSAAVGAPQLGVEGPPAVPTQAVLDAAGIVGTSQVITFGGTDLVSDAHATAIHAAGQ